MRFGRKTRTQSLGESDFFLELKFMCSFGSNVIQEFGCKFLFLELLFRHLLFNVASTVKGISERTLKLADAASGRGRVDSEARSSPYPPFSRPEPLG